MKLVGLALESAFVENLALASFLGLCTLLGTSRSVRSAAGMALAVAAVLLVTVPLNHQLQRWLLAPGAFAWLGHPEIDLSDLGLLVFVGVIAASVQVLELVLARWFPALEQAFGHFLPLVTVNCAILAGSLFVVERGYGLAQSVAFAAGSALGWGAAVLLLAAIRERVRAGAPAADPGGLGIAFVVVGILSAAFLAFTRVQFG